MWPLFASNWPLNLPTKLSQTARRCRRRQRRQRPQPLLRLDVFCFLPLLWRRRTGLASFPLSGMAQRRASHRSVSLQDPALHSRRKLQSRRAPTGRRRVFNFNKSYIDSNPSSHASGSSPPPSSRAVLVPVQFNLRRLPSRIFSDHKESMRNAASGYDVSIGMKRKRVVSGSENTSGRSARSHSRAKRRKALPDSSDEELQDEMEVDEEQEWDSSVNSEDEEALDSCTRRSSHLSLIHCPTRVAADNYLINEAPSQRLLRFRKDELVRLYAAAGLTEDAELLTKPEIVDSIIAARDDVADLPPSSPGVASGSSDYSSDGGNVAGGEETDFTHRFRNGIRRRATVNGLGRISRRDAPDRSLSMSHIERSISEGSPTTQGKRKRCLPDTLSTQHINGHATRRCVL